MKITRNADKVFYHLPSTWPVLKHPLSVEVALRPCNKTEIVLILCYTADVVRSIRNILRINLGVVQHSPRYVQIHWIKAFGSEKLSQIGNEIDTTICTCSRYKQDRPLDAEGKFGRNIDSSAKLRFRNIIRRIVRLLLRVNDI